MSQINKITKEDTHLIVGALRTNQKSGIDTYSFFLPGSKLIKIANISRITKDVDENLKGFQRKEIKNHVNGIVEYLDEGDVLFPNEPKIKPWKYFNGGFQITNKKHIPFYNKVKEYYTTNINIINQLSEQIKAGTDQTIINYLVQQNSIDTTYMSESYNLQDLFRKNLLHIPGHSWFPDELRFLEAGWVYHFNAIPQNDRHVSYWMERTYKELYT